jgi:proteic killer suppression protein
MIRSFRHKRLEAFFCKGEEEGIGAEYRPKLKLLLSALNGATELQDLQGASGFHRLKGDRKGHWAMKVSANWRLTFSFKDGHVVNVDFEDYHGK